LQAPSHYLLEWLPLGFSPHSLQPIPTFTFFFFPFGKQTLKTMTLKVTTYLGEIRKSMHIHTQEY
jgi:hypothetical protein